MYLARRRASKYGVPHKHFVDVPHKHFVEHLMGVRQAATENAATVLVDIRCPGLRSASLPCALRPPMFLRKCATVRLLPDLGQELTTMATG